MVPISGWIPRRFSKQLQTLYGADWLKAKYRTGGKSLEGWTFVMASAATYSVIVGFWMPETFRRVLIIRNEALSSEGIDPQQTGK